MVNESHNQAGELVGISVRRQDVEIQRMDYVAHLLLGVKKGWAHADNLALRLWGVKAVGGLKNYQLTAVINELRCQVKDFGGLV